MSLKGADITIPARQPQSSRLHEHTAGAGPRGRVGRGVSSPAFYDWMGTVSAQEDITAGPRLEALAGLDPHSWKVVGLGIIPACDNSCDDAVYFDAVDLTSLGIAGHRSGFRELIAFGEQYAALPVTRILTSGLGARGLLSYMTRAVVYAQAAGVADIELRVVAQHTHHHSARQ